MGNIFFSFVLLPLPLSSGTSSLLGLSDVTDNKLIWRQLVAELLGSFLLAAVGVAACIAVTDAAAPQVTSIALCFGLLVATIVQVCEGYLLVI